MRLIAVACAGDNVLTASPNTTPLNSRALNKVAPASNPRSDGNSSGALEQGGHRGASVGLGSKQLGLLTERLPVRYFGAPPLRLDMHQVIEIIHLSFGDPGPIRTGGLRFRKPLLYPAELRGQSIEIKDNCPVDAYHKFRMLPNLIPRPQFPGPRLIASPNAMFSRSDSVVEHPCSETWNGLVAGEAVATKA